jgi:rhodanese-related sulfurtransferase
MRNLIRYCCSGVFAVLIGLGSAGVQADAEVSPKEAAALQSAKKALIVDVREDDEWQAQHIPGAIHIPLGQLENRLGELKSQHSPLIMQCRSGKRSAKAQATLKAAGFSDVYNMEGGLIAWQQQGLAVE